MDIRERDGELQTQFMRFQNRVYIIQAGTESQRWDGRNRSTTQKLEQSSGGIGERRSVDGTDREHSMETGKEMLYRRNLRAGEESEYRRLLSREVCNLVE